MHKLFYKTLLKFFLKLHEFSYEKASAAAIKLYGIHPKHRFNDFHAFFLKHIPAGAIVLDIGCSRGELTREIAGKASKVTGVDVCAVDITRARACNTNTNIEYLAADALASLSRLPQKHYDVAVCSNVLEHLEHSADFLLELTRVASTLLVRVPNVESSWIAGVKKELGMRYHFDPQHHREYSPETLSLELQQAGWTIDSMEITHELRVIARRTVQ